ncbi:MAG: hypothetical protein KJ896_02300, partial [Nanoarchaeota archaeon]|nr:hypothetical protein [Nanoarchaeota archaeon]
NYSMNNITTSIYNYSAILPAGTHYWKSYANDTINQLNETGQWNFTITKATVTLNLSISPAWNVTYPTSTTANCSADNDEVTPLLYMNGINVGVPYTTTHGSGTYNYTCNFSETQNYTTTETSNILSVNKSTSICSLAFDPVSPSTYGIPLNVSCNCTNTETTAQLWENGTNVTNQNNQNITLAASTYAYVCNVSETANWTSASNSSTYIINKAATTVNLTLNGTESNLTITYPENLTAEFWTSFLTATLYQNGTNVSSQNGTSIRLAAGNYNYTVINPGNQNYSSSSKTFFVTINKGATTLTLNASPSWNETYPTSTTVNCTADNTEATPILYLNGTNVSIAYTTTHGAATYNYTCNVSETQNYTAIESSNILTINQNTSTEINLLLNGTDGNITINVNDYVNHTATIVTPSSGYLELYREGVLIGSGTSPVTNISAYSVGGTFNITAIFNETTNYSSASETHFVIVNDTESPNIITTYLNPYDPTVGENVSLNITATDNGAISGRFANITLPNTTTITVPVYAEYTTQIPERHNVTFWVNDTSGNIATFDDYFIASQPRVNVTFNVVNNSFGGIATNLTIYFANTRKQVDFKNFIGTYLRNHTSILYDLYYEVLGGNITVKLNNVNVSIDYNDTLGIDLTDNVTGYILTYGIYSTYNNTDANVTISYASANYSDESDLTVDRCADWNFTTRNCTSTWVEISAVQNTTADTFTFNTTGFSAFSIEETTTPVPPPTPSSCFPSGTKILMADNIMTNDNYKNIEDVNVGDRVKSYDFTTGQLITATVLELESPVRDHLCEIIFTESFAKNLKESDSLQNNNIGDKDNLQNNQNNILQLTNEHPVYTIDGWKAIDPQETLKENSELKLNGKLSVGDKVLFANNVYHEIENINCWNEIVQTYNLKSVSGTNTFYADNVLVHNKGPSGTKKQCEDSKDNDGDGFIDYPIDPGCDSYKDDDETDISCKENWGCNSWSECEDEMQYRVCEDLNDCEGKVAKGLASTIEEMPKPTEERECDECIPEWSCGEWDPVECLSEIDNLTRTCYDLNGCDSDIDKPAEYYDCLVAGVIFPPEKEVNLSGMAAYITSNLKEIGMIALLLLCLLLLTLILLTAFRKKAVVTKECLTCMEVEQYLDSTALRIKPGVSIIVNTNVSVDCNNDAKIKNRIYNPKQSEEDLALVEQKLRKVVKKGELCLERERKDECDFRNSPKCQKKSLKEYRPDEKVYIKRDLKRLQKRRNSLSEHNFDVKEL